MIYRILRWEELYEVTDKGGEWKPEKHKPEQKRVGPLNFVRLRVFGNRRGPGWENLEDEAGEDQMLMVFGLFCKTLELAAQHPRAERSYFEDLPGAEKRERDLARLFHVPRQQVDRALQIMEHIEWIAAVEQPFPGIPGKPGFPEFPAIPGIPANQPTNPTNPTQPTACARASGDGSDSVSEAVAKPGEPGPSRWVLARAEARTAFPGDPGVRDALTAIANSLLSDGPKLDEAAVTIRELIGEAKSKGDRPAAYFMGALRKRYDCTRQKRGKRDAPRIGKIPPPI